MASLVTHAAAPECELVLPGGQVQLVEVVLEDELASLGRLAAVVGGDAQLGGHAPGDRRTQQQRSKHLDRLARPIEPKSSAMTGILYTL